jgi:curved DNA-binding protein CbpA
MKSEKDHYKLLCIAPSASAQEIKKAYRKLAFQYHPDRNHASQEANEKMQEINEAYATLSDPIKRKEYDIPRGYRTLAPKFKKGSVVRVSLNSTSPYRDHTGVVDKEPLKDTYRFWYIVKFESKGLAAVSRFAEEELDEVSQ